MTSDVALAPAVWYVVAYSGMLRRKRRNMPHCASLSCVKHLRHYSSNTNSITAVQSGPAAIKITISISRMCNKTTT